MGSRNSPGSQVASNPRQAAYEMRMQNNSSPSISPNTSFTSDGSPSPIGGIKRKAEDSDSEPEPEDNVRWNHFLVTLCYQIAGIHAA